MLPEISAKMTKSAGMTSATFAESLIRPSNCVEFPFKLSLVKPGD
jgi:hypothetical protein